MIGYHVIWEMYECSEELISHKEPIEKTLNLIVEKLKINKVSESYKQFSPVGVTGVILLEESHLSIHTWPEHQYAAVDIFSCKYFNHEVITEELKHLLGSEKSEVQVIIRGQNLVSKEILLS